MSKQKIALFNDPLQSKSLGRLDFLLALCLLMVNDLFLKEAFNNWFTGKLSDFAGLYALLFLLRRVTNNRFNNHFLKFTLALGFIYWKSELSDGFLTFWNSLRVFQLHRVVDFIDLMALSVLFLDDVWSFKKIPALRVNRIAVMAISLFAFVATSVPAKRIFILDQEDQVYNFQMPKDTLVSFIQSMDRSQDIMYEPIGFNRIEPTSSYYNLVDSVVKYELVYDTLQDIYRRFPHGIFKVIEQGNNSTIVLQKTFWMDVYIEDYNSKLKRKSIRSFERRFIKKIKKREKNYLKKNR